MARFNALVYNRETGETVSLNDVTGDFVERQVAALIDRSKPEPEPNAEVFAREIYAFACRLGITESVQPVTGPEILLLLQEIGYMAAAPAPPPWQPIETAPKDGTELLLTEFRNGEYGHIEHGSWGFLERSDWDGKAVYGWMTDFGSLDEPTHWMPALPKPLAAAPAPPPQEPSKSSRFVPEQFSTGSDRHNAPKAWLDGYDTAFVKVPRTTRPCYGG